MNWKHWLTIAFVLVIGYAVGVMYPAVGKSLGSKVGVGA